jgi:hypothetical protein
MAKLLVVHPVLLQGQIEHRKGGVSGCFHSLKRHPSLVEMIATKIDSTV